MHRVQYYVVERDKGSISRITRENTINICLRVCTGRKKGRRERGEETPQTPQQRDKIVEIAIYKILQSGAHIHPILKKVHISLLLFPRNRHIEEGKRGQILHNDIIICH